MSPAQTLSGSVTVNSRFSRLGEIGRSWLLSVVTLKRRLPLARMPCSCMSFLHPLLAHANAACEQLLPDARPAVAATGLGMDGLDVHQQRIVAQVAALRVAGPANEVLVIPSHADLQHPALHRDRPHAPVALDEGVLHFDPFAKYAVAFLRNTLRRRLLKREAELCGASVQLLDDALAVLAFVLISTGVSVVHPESHRVVEQHRDLAGGGCYRFGLADARGQASVEGAQCGVRSADGCSGQAKMRSQAIAWSCACAPTAPCRR